MRQNNGFQSPWKPQLLDSTAIEYDMMSEYPFGTPPNFDLGIFSSLESDFDLGQDIIQEQGIMSREDTYLLSVGKLSTTSRSTTSSNTPYYFLTPRTIGRQKPFFGRFLILRPHCHFVW